MPVTAESVFFIKLGRGGEWEGESLERGTLRFGYRETPRELCTAGAWLFAKQEPREKRRLLNFLLSNCTWEDSEVVATFRQPFDLLAETAVTAARVAPGDTTKTAKTEIWLGN